MVIMKHKVGYLASALEHIKNDDYYPTITDKITHLIFSCVKFHPFADEINGLRYF